MEHKHSMIFGSREHLREARLLFENAAPEQARIPAVQEDHEKAASKAAEKAFSQENVTKHVEILLRAADKKAVDEAEKKNGIISAIRDIAKVMYQEGQKTMQEKHEDQFDQQKFDNAFKAKLDALFAAKLQQKEFVLRVQMEEGAPRVSMEKKPEGAEKMLPESVGELLKVLRLKPEVAKRSFDALPPGMQKAIEEAANKLTPQDRAKLADILQKLAAAQPGLKDNPFALFEQNRQAGIGKIVLEAVRQGKVGLNELQPLFDLFSNFREELLKNNPGLQKNQPPAPAEGAPPNAAPAKPPETQGEELMGQLNEALKEMKNPQRRMEGMVKAIAAGVALLGSIFNGSFFKKIEKPAPAGVGQAGGPEKKEGGEDAKQRREALRQEADKKKDNRNIKSLQQERGKELESLISNAAGGATPETNIPSARAALAEAEGKRPQLVRQREEEKQAFTDAEKEKQPEAKLQPLRDAIQQTEKSLKDCEEEIKKQGDNLKRLNQKKDRLKRDIEDMKAIVQENKDFTVTIGKLKSEADGQLKKGGKYREGAEKAGKFFAKLDVQEGNVWPVATLEDDASVANFQELAMEAGKKNEYAAMGIDPISQDNRLFEVRNAAAFLETTNAVREHAAKGEAKK